MSAPAGWHVQPDGRERFWDGTRWTDQFRAVDSPQLSDPTAPPPAPSWAQSGDDGSSSGGDPTAPVSDPTSEAATPAWDQTQALDVSSTQAIPATQPSTDQGQSAYGQSDPYASQPSAFGTPAGGYGAPTAGYGAPGVPGQPGPGWQPPQRSSGVAKGCLIAGIIGFLALAIAVVLAVFFISRAVDQVSDDISSSLPSGLPSDLPTELPSDLPTELPSDLPTEGLGERIEVTVGRGFAVPRAAIQDGWSLQKQGAGALSVVTIEGMTATIEDQDGFPVLFTIGFPPAGGGDVVRSVCTAPSGSAGATVDVSCVPLLGDVVDARQGTVTTTL